jgi:hypothetical protein
VTSETMSFISHSAEPEAAGIGPCRELSKNSLAAESSLFPVDSQRLGPHAEALAGVPKSVPNRVLAGSGRVVASGAMVSSQDSPAN